MIRPEYVEVLKKTRESWKDWGSSASNNCDGLVKYLNKHDLITSVLDFGCGTGSLKYYLNARTDLRSGIVIDEYDPSIDEYDELPDKHYDLIVTLDVLEHVEPESLDETLAWIDEHSLRQYHHIDCNDGGGDKLADGRDVHLIIEPPSWWVIKVSRDGWRVMRWDRHSVWKRGRYRTSTTIIKERQG
jgi:SAM-dependent methyltransferase